MTMVLQRPAALMLLLLVHVAAAVLATTEDLWPNMLGRAAIKSDDLEAAAAPVPTRSSQHTTCLCPGQPAALCRPLPHAPSPAQRDVHVYSDCEAPGAGGATVSCDWKNTLDLSVATTVVEGSKDGGQLMVDVRGNVIWHGNETGSSELICAAHARGVRVLAIAGRLKIEHDKTRFDYKALLSNASAMRLAASQLAEAASAAGFDGVEFDMEALGAPYDTATPDSDPFDYGTPFVSLLTQTRAALRAQQPHATVHVAVGAFNASSKEEKVVARAYPMAALAAATDGIFIMGYDMNHAHCFCARANAPLAALEELMVYYVDRLHVPPSKLILGVPWYGYTYFCNSTNPAQPLCDRSTCFAGTVQHLATHTPTVLWQVHARLASGQGCTRGWDELQGSPYMDCPASPGVARSQVWYDDANSTRLKAALAARLSLGGIGLFSANMAGRLGEAATTQAWGALSAFTRPSLQ